MKTNLGFFFQELQEEGLNFFHPTDNQHLSRVVVNILDMTVRNIIEKKSIWCLFLSVSFNHLCLVLCFKSKYK